MKITCNCCKKKFKPSFADLVDNSQDASYLCPHCHATTYRTDLSDFEKMQLETEELKRNNEAYEEDSEES